MTDGVRLQLVIARAGVASRRAAEDLILGGRVTVNGQVVAELGARAAPDDVVAVDGRPLVPEMRMRYLALNKPPGYLCASSDDRGRPLALDLLKPDIRERVYNIGRLDMQSCGLVLFTNDGDFASRAGHPSSGLRKEYYVETDGFLPPEFAEAFVRGIEDEGETLTAEGVEFTGPRSAVMRLVEGRNREIRRALAAFGLAAITLRRVAVGPLRLGDLPEGRWRELSVAELAALDAAMARKSRPSGRLPGRPARGGER